MNDSIFNYRGLDIEINCNISGNARTAQSILCIIGVSTVKLG